MQRIMESLFDICYLIFAIGMGIYLIKNAKDKITKNYGIMSLILGCGDAFHLIPRIYALNTTGFEQNAAILGFGKAVTSITMTIFYLILYKIYKDHYKEENKNLTFSIIILATVRIIISLLPQNMWLEYHQPMNFAIYRNIPFAIMGIIMIILFYKKSKLKDVFKTMYIAIFLSFAFYAPVVLFAGKYPLVGLLMIPKTIAYIYIVYLGYKYYKSSLKNEA